MLKTKEELTALKEEVEAMSKKFAELDDDELEQVSGGKTTQVCRAVLTRLYAEQSAAEKQGDDNPVIAREDFVLVGYEGLNQQDLESFVLRDAFAVAIYGKKLI